MMLIAIIYLACAAFVLVHIGKAPRIDADGLPDEPSTERHEDKRGSRLGDDPKGNDPPSLSRGRCDLLPALHSRSQAETLTA